MTNIGEPQFDYESFKKVYDSSDSLKTLVKDFDEKSISLNTGDDNIELAQNKDLSKERISKTAASAAPKGLKDRHSTPS